MTRTKCATWRAISATESAVAKQKGPPVNIRDDTTTKIIELLLPLPPGDRAEVIAAVRYNGIFCPDCGYGDLARPNPHCQCQNDE